MTILQLFFSSETWYIWYDMILKFPHAMLQEKNIFPELQIYSENIQIPWRSRPRKTEAQDSKVVKQ